MLHKRSAPSKASTNEAKQQKKFKTLQEKVELLDLLREKKSYAAVARHYGFNESTVRYIKKNEAAIRSTVAVSFCDSFATDAENPGPSTAPDPQDFQASKGWFDRFQKRFNIKSVSLHGEAASADIDAAQKYPETFRHMIEEKGYKPEQVFNMDETGLFWKKMLSRTYIMKDEAKAPGFKAQKDRVTLIMCGNAAGYMMKPGLIHKSANPRALKNKNKNLLPVYWMHNAKAWITKVLGSNWFHQCFIPQAKEYLHNLGMDFKVLLIMDNAGGHPLDLYYEGVQIEFLPANATSLIQPMDQGVIRAFKALYTRNSLQHLETLNACWKKLWPECVHDYKGLSPEEIQHEAVDKAVTLAKILGGEGFEDITQDEVNNLIDSGSVGRRQSVYSCVQNYSTPTEIECFGQFDIDFDHSVILLTIKSKRHV
uniref:DDE-1 domain-containing protein n=1 Tax=Leptobrachium leishanense TaxID=445787 RepID=A0A8C5PZV7_9ANUR